MEVVNVKLIIFCRIILGNDPLCVLLPKFQAAV